MIVTNVNRVVIELRRDMVWFRFISSHRRKKFLFSNF